MHGTKPTIGTRAVEVESPRLIRSSPVSTYQYGLTELRVGDPHRAISHFLDTFNLHQDRDEAGTALNQIAGYLQDRDHEFLSLWFSP